MFFSSSWGWESFDAVFALVGDSQRSKYAAAAAAAGGSFVVVGVFCLHFALHSGRRIVAKSILFIALPSTCAKISKYEISVQFHFDLMDALAKTALL